MKTETETTNDWKCLENDNLQMAFKYLQKYDGDIKDYLAECVASMCNISVEEMFKDTSVAYIAQPRWLYWYAIRYMMNETYEKIALQTHKKCGHYFTPNGIGQSINKMNNLINQEPMWKKRWTIIKRIIKLRDTANEMTQETITMRVIVPKGIKVELKTE